MPHQAAGTGTDPEAAWGHRNVGRKVQEGEMFFGYYLSAAVMVADEHGPAHPRARPPDHRLLPGPRPRRRAGRRAHRDARTAASSLGDIIADSGYSHRVPATWAEPLRAAGASLVQDLHPNDRGPHGTHHGAIIANGNLYCPATPGPLLDLVPLPPGATADDLAAHDQKTAELARYKLGVHAADDADGYRRHACPAAAGKIRCPLRPESMKLDRDRPEILHTPSTRRPAAPSRPSPPGPPSRPRPGKSTTTHRPPGGPPTGGAPPPNGSTPRSRTPPPAPSTAAGSA